MKHDSKPQIESPLQLSVHLVGKYDLAPLNPRQPIDISDDIIHHILALNDRRSPLFMQLIFFINTQLNVFFPYAYKNHSIDIRNINTMKSLIPMMKSQYLIDLLITITFMLYHHILNRNNILITEQKQSNWVYNHRTQTGDAK